MKLIISFLICISTLINKTLTKHKFSLHKFETESGARCLDGSQYGVYHSAGFGKGKKNLLINFWGGGLCQGRTIEALLDDCVSRSKDELGSSSLWSAEAEFESGFLATEANKNSNFYDWNKFDFPYCDGTFHQGNLNEPINHNGSLLFLRGFQNVLNALSFVTKQVDLTQIEKVVITGGSTGGYATYTYIDYIRNTFHKINPSLKFYGIPDSGFFVDYYSYKTKDRDYHLMNKLFYETFNKDHETLNSECLKRNASEKDLCLLPEHFVQDIQTPLLIIQSGYDSSNLSETVGLECVQNDTLSGCDEDSKKYAHIFKVYQNALIKQEVNRKNNFSAWLPSCVTHCFEDKMDSEDWNIPENSGFTVYKAVERFLANPEDKFVEIDEFEWPGNGKCANADQLEFLVAK